MRLLFLCSRNHWRSPTAEALYQNDARVEVRSAGVSASAKRRVSEKLLRWADHVLIMEPAHKRKLREDFPALFQELSIEVLDIPDDFEFMRSRSHQPDSGRRGASARPPVPGLSRAFA